MARASSAAALRVAVAWSAREGEACEVGVELPEGASVLDAIRATGVLEAGGAVDISTQAIGIWGRAATLETHVAQGDRVEIYRPLLLDPKEARRLRARRRK
jgi:uncharacterized protein